MMVDGRCVAEVLGEVRPHGLEDLGQNRGGRVVVEIDSAHEAPRVILRLSQGYSVRCGRLLRNLLYDYRCDRRAKIWRTRGSCIAMVEGFWIVQYEGVQGNGGGVVVFMKGRVLGGDTGFVYTGTYQSTEK